MTPQTSALPIAALAPFAIHASVVVIGENGVLVRGRSGAGKSALALALVETARSGGRFARLVADDRTVLREAGGRLIVAPHPRIAGFVERRFVGIATALHEDGAVAALVVDLVETATGGTIARLPDEDAHWCTIAGVRLPRLAFPSGHMGAVEAVLDFLRRGR